jgi:glucose/arabinose dehydrogenase
LARAGSIRSRENSAWLLAAVLAAAWEVASGGIAAGQTLPPAFRDKVVFNGLNMPTAMAFASDGRVFVAEKSGVIKVFASLTATTPTVFADLRTRVYNYWDRGLLGLALHPNFPATPYVYILYAYNGDIGGSFPKWTGGDGTSDTCPTPPGGTTDGCTVSGRLSRLTANGNVWDGTETVLIHDWFQQFPSHSIGTLMFGNDGALYATGGDGASFNFADYGQIGNPGGDPPSPVGTNLTPPTAEGGALRSQDLRTTTGTDPVTLDGTLIRIDPNTGAAMPDNPLFSNPDVNAKRIVAYGLRNPFRFTQRPGTNEIWIGDVGWNTWEEINRLQNPLSLTNFGWPCYEGVGHQFSYDNLNLNICENLYTQQPSPVTAPLYTYNHSAKIVPGETCSTGSSSVSGIAFYTGSTYPATYQNALFFADYSRNCIWTMLPGAGGVPDPAQIQNFVVSAPSPVQIMAGPGGDLFYADINGGKIHRIQYFVPNAVISANPTTGSAPLTVNFDGSGSTHPDPTETLSYSWDLNGDGVFGDATTAQTSHVYEDPGDVTVTLKVSDTHGGVDTDTVVIHANNTAPVPTISTPAPTLTWKVGDVISFSGSATDPQDDTIPASGLTWSLIIHHCPSDCHIHNVQSFSGAASGSFAAPDHEYPSHLELKLTATDSGGLQASTSVLLFPQTVTMSFATNPAGLQLSWDATTAAAPFNNSVIIGSLNSLSAPVTQNLGANLYEFVSWSDGGAATHTVVAPAAPATLTATYALRPPPSSVLANPPSVVGGTGSTGSVTLSGPAPPSGADVALSSSSPSAIVPALVHVDPGATTATFAISTTAVASQTAVTLTGNYGNGSAAGGLTLEPPTNVPPAVSITSPASGATFTAPASISIQATASDSDGTVTRVDFYSNGVLLGSATSAPYAWSWSGVQAGAYSLTAIATDNLGATTTSSAVPGTVENPTTNLPTGWSQQDIGPVGLPGGGTYSGGAFTVQGSGTDIYGYSDQFHFVYQPLSGDGEIRARVVSIQNTNAYLKVGVMIRQSLAANSPYAMMEMLPNSSGFQWRLTTGGATTSVGSSGKAPYWIRLVRGGNVFTAYRSVDGNNWIQVGSPTTVNLTSAIYAGLAVTSHNNAATCTAVFDNVTTAFGPANAPPTASITNPTDGAVLQDPTSVTIDALASDPDGSVTQVAFYDGANLLGTLTTPPWSFPWSNPPAGAHSLTVRATDNGGLVTTSAAVGVTVNYTTTSLPSPWVERDIGPVGVAGSASYTAGSFTVLGSGTDIYGYSDQFHFVYQTLNGDGEIKARVVSIQNTNNYAKAGLMIRQDLTANSPYAMMEMLPNSSGFQWRLTTGGATASVGLSGKPPYWIRLVRSGNTLTAYRSADGNNWSQVGSPMTVNLTTSVYIGLAVTSHNNTTTSTSVFDNVTKIGN